MIGPHRGWPELVFHVLCHVDVAAPASVHDRVYADWVASRIGPADERPLGEDARVLARVLPGHQALAAVQLLAWLFDDLAQASACAATDLGALDPSAVARPELLGPLGRLGPAVEVLRCAAELECEAFAALPPVWLDAEGVARALADRVEVAPGLARARLVCLRSLRLRGRVRGREIFVGCPGCEVGPTVEHVAWQAAHEATVSELSEKHHGEAGSWPARERQVEEQALRLLGVRAAAAGQAEAHERWLARCREM